MGKQKKTRKYATMKRMLSLRDERLKEKDRLKPKKKEKKDPSALKEREVPHITVSSIMLTIHVFTVTNHDNLHKSP
uniref:Uncharacterized protein n=1 Tax=Peromyscus maniculatus bairdii TaxID=230844 RepID=A0A8C8UDB6_PERMB